MALKKIIALDGAVSVADTHDHEDKRDWPTALHAEDPATRREAARHLRMQPESASLLGARLQVETDDSVRETLFNSLAHLGGDAAVVALLPLLGLEDDANLRNGAIECLKQLPQALSPHMAQMLEDPDPDRRIFAVNICESLRTREVEAWLIGVIEQDDHVNVCATAIDLLGEVGSVAALPALRQVAERFRGDPFMKFATDLAIRRIGTSLDGEPS